MKLKSLNLVLCFAAPAATALAAESQLADVLVSAERDDFDARQTAKSTRLVYGREELDRMNELIPVVADRRPSPQASMCRCGCRPARRL